MLLLEPWGLLPMFAAGVTTYLVAAIAVRAVTPGELRELPRTVLAARGVTTTVPAG
jgi:hypothetical protein